MKYYIDDIEREESEFWNLLEEEVNAEVEAHYDDMLDDAYPEVKIGCCTFYASEILSKCDPIAYNCGKDDWVSARLEDYKSDLESGEDIWVNIYHFEIKEAEEDE